MIELNKVVKKVKKELLKKNIKVIIIDEKNGQVDLNALIKKLGE